MSYDFSGVTDAFTNLASQLKGPVLQIALSVVGVVVIVFLVRYGINWFRRIGSK